MNLETVLSEARRIQGWMTDEELRWLAVTAQSCTRIVEVGSWKGRSTKALSGMTAGCVWAVDTWEGSPDELETWHREAVERGPDAMFADFCENLAPEIAAGRCVPLRQTSELVAQSLGALLRPDLVFLDGDHSTSGIRGDLVSWTEVIGPQCIIAGHDFGAVEPVITTFFDARIKRGPGLIWYVLPT